MYKGEKKARKKTRRENNICKKIQKLKLYYLNIRGYE